MVTTIWFAVKVCVSRLATPGKSLNHHAMASVHLVPAFRDNYIWLVANGHGQCVAVDPGDPHVTVDALRNLQLELVGLLITHHHHDHIGGISALKQHFNIPVYGPAHEKIAGITHTLKEGDYISILQNVGFDVLDVPGHTAGHIAFYHNNNMFLGDTLFGAGCGRLFDGTAAQLHASLNKVAALPTSTRVYCAHEYTAANLKFARHVEPGNDAIAQRLTHTLELRSRNQATVPLSLGEEMLTNPFLRCHVPELRQSVQSHCGCSLPSTLAVFTELRSWKDGF